MTQPAAVVLLLDSPPLIPLVAQLGAIATLPLLFTLNDLITAVQQGASAQAEDAHAATVVGAGAEW